MPFSKGVPFWIFNILSTPFVIISQYTVFMWILGLLSESQTGHLKDC